MKIVIVAGKNKAKYLLKTFLRRKYDIVYINKDRDFCREISREYDLSKVICGDATKPSTLDDARIKTYDLLISLCRNDADNIVICRLADRMGIKRQISVVNNPANINAFDKLGVDTTVSMASIISLVIEKNAFTQSVESLLPLEDGKALLLEVEIEEDFETNAKQIMELGLPEGSVISCIMRGGEAIIPRGNTVLEAGDKVIIVTLPAVKQRVVRIMTELK